MYQLALLASLSDRKGQALFSRKFGVSLGEWRTLANIVVLEPVSLADLSRSMLLDKGQLSRTVQRLVQRRWVVSHAAPGNRGALMLTVTDAGRERYAALLDYAWRRNERTMSVLTSDEQACFVTCIRKLRGYMEREFAVEVEHQGRRDLETQVS